MRVALITFEFPPDTPYGGIASYMTEIAQMLTNAGHEVEVFCAGHVTRTESFGRNVPVHIIGGLDKDRFADALLPSFSVRHSERRFDVVECADINSDGRGVRRQFPNLPLVLKLHGPTFLCHRVNHVPLRLAEMLRFTLGALRRGRFAWLKPDLSVLAMRNRHESAFYREADVVASPSRDLIQLTEAEWGSRPDGIGHLPNPISLTEELLAVPPAVSGGPLLFLGRLEILKGTSDLIEALHLLEKSDAPVRTNFVGAPFPSPKRGMKMDEWAAGRLRLASGNYRFTGPIPRTQIAQEFTRSSLVALPSRWDNFPYTCLEAMAAGRAVIAGAMGGMRDMITDGEDGFLVPPASPAALADKIRNCLALPPGRLVAVGAAARQRVLSAYSPAAILPQQLSVYQRAIDAVRRREKTNA